MAASASSPRLTILGGPHAGQELTLDEAVDNILVGSDPSCRFHIDLPGVSPIHARLWVDWQGLTVYDTGAPEGVYLNDDRVERSAPVRNGDFLWLGPPGGDGVVLIQCRVPPRAAAAPVDHPVETAAAAPASVAPAGDATATLITAPRPEAEPPAGAFTDTLAFTTDMTAGEPAEEAVTYEPEPDAAGAVDTVWITPAAEEAAPVEPETIAEPDATLEAAATVEMPAPVAIESAAFTTPTSAAESDFEAETVVLHVGVAPEVAVTPAAGLAPADDATEIIDEPVKFEIDEPPPALAGHPALFEEDIEEPPTLVNEPVDALPEDAAAETVVVPPPPPAPVVAPPPARVPPPAPPRVATPPPTPAVAQSIPRAVTQRPSPATGATKPATPRAASGAGRYLALAAVALIVLAAGGFAAYRFLLSPAPPTPAPTGAATVAPPVTLAQAQVEEPATPTPAPSAPLEEAVTIVPTPPAAGTTPAPTPTPKATPSARPGPTPKPGAPGATPTTAPAPEAARESPAAQAATLVTQGDSALGEHRYDAAAALYAQALQLDPQNPQALAGRTRAQAGAAAAKRTFVAGRSLLVGAKSGKKGPAGFDDEDVQVAKAPDYSGRLEFEASPRSLKPGDSYTVRIFLVNDGKKEFKISAFSAVTSANGEKSGGPMAPATRDVATQKRELVQELSGVWKDGLNAWSLEASVTSSHGEVVRNTLTWK